jgi:hypothetical protein
MDTNAPATERSPAADKAEPAKADTPPPIIPTSAANFIQLQKQLKCVAKQAFEFRNTKTGSRVITKDLMDFQAVKLHFQSNNLSFYSFFSKSEKPIKAVIRHLPPINTPAEDIAEGLGDRDLTGIVTVQFSLVMQGVLKRALQWYFKYYYVASITKTFTLKRVQTIHRSRWPL